MAELVTASYAYDVDRSDPFAPGRLPGAVPAPGRRQRPWVRRLVWGLVLGMLALTFFGVWMMAIRPLGFGSSLVAFTAALVPVAIVLTAVWWIDRYTPQPRITLVYAFAWGAAASVALSLVIGSVVMLLLSEPQGGRGSADFLGAVVQAPLVEESAKSAGVVLLLLWGRRFLSTPIDGVVYATLAAAGFAFTENILYFGESFAQAQAVGEADVFWRTFVLRGLLSPFAHACFTSLCGLGLGLGMARRSIPLTVGLGLIGLCTGMGLHALWNSAAFLLDLDPERPVESFLRYYLIVQVPIFLTIAGIVITLRLRERRIVRRRLAEYGRAGWFSPQEVDTMVALRGRRRAEKWAARHGAIARIGMHDLIRSSVELAVERESALHGRITPRIRARERELLERITADRRLVSALARSVVPGRPRAGEGAATR
ncbi:PrsW family intramembrane metalloprotease [Brachybacterium sp. EF45031]|uniref:PrsW family intramembrane metalloprotease n=1 Tax=Brachybacterium sillae TaxID=2810536 RepID=UPI00217EA954|nr:PrsW family intramembrane metalloprotease [Brachybacterium sillae]MCS6712719.1 PrsW family intramembrane metalloprotease [Brachybacterium sillae]